MLFIPACTVELKKKKWSESWACELLQAESRRTAMWLLAFLLKRCTVETRQAAVGRGLMGAVGELPRD